MAGVQDIRIVHSAEALTNAIAAFENCKNNVQMAYLQEQSAMLTLDMSWNGEASEAFKNKFTVLTQNISSSDKTMEDAIKFLKSVIAENAAVEESVSADFQNMPDTVDPFSEG